FLESAAPIIQFKFFAPKVQRDIAQGKDSGFLESAARIIQFRFFAPKVQRDIAQGKDSGFLESAALGLQHPIFRALKGRRKPKNMVRILADHN
ncbi:MAG: hypothetical protein ACR2IE_13025, partial [Candidatus Sumerlaeaceae bacterium]